MAVNIEIKAKVHDAPALRAVTETISDTPCETLVQEDVFFNVEKGRLKVRIYSAEYGELIYYERDNVSGPKPSNYFISRTQEPETLKQVLELSLGIRGVVRKTRLLYMAGNTRIHLDEVEGLGSYMELEVVLTPEQSQDDGQRIANEWMAQLNIQTSDLIDVAYIDLLESI